MGDKADKNDSDSDHQEPLPHWDPEHLHAHFHSHSSKRLPERPLECSECKKPIVVRYTEIVGPAITHTSMCQDCPELQRRLRGSTVHTIGGILHGEGVTGLACGNCGTTLEAIRVGNPLGCSNCYEVFDEILLAEMHEAEQIPSRITPTKKSIPIHIGRAPGEVQEMNPTLRLLALNEALSETLIREDYEQAAWLRDQIKAITENKKNGKGEDE